MQQALLTAALAFTGWPAAAAAAPRDTVATLAADTEARWVPFEMTPGNQIRFAMQIDGKSVTAVLDTGVSYSLLATRYVATERRKAQAIGSASAIGGDVAVGWVPTGTIAIGGLTRTGGGIAVADLPATAIGSMRPADLLVGRDLLADYALDIDYEGHRFRLIPSGRLPFAGTTAPLTVSPTRLVYVSTLTLGASQLAPMIVDTGDGSSVTLSSASWSQAGSAPASRMTDTISYGIGGAIVTRLAILPRARIGELTARNVEVRIEGADGFSQSIDVAGRIGSGFLQRYRVLLDPAAGHMVFAPNASTDQTVERSTSGLLMGLDKGALVVLHVMRGSPAAASGWKTGERICSVDGAAIARDYASTPLAHWSAGAPGRIVRLGLCGGGERRLTLRSFY